MSGQYLSPSGGGHALTPPRRQSLGKPLPYQLADVRLAAPPVESHLYTQVFKLRRSSGITHSFPWLSPSEGYVTNPSYPVCRSPRIATVRARLACLIHAANVHSEPGSNPSCNLLEQQPKLSLAINRIACPTCASSQNDARASNSANSFLDHQPNFQRTASRPPRGGSATGRRIIARASGESINPFRFFSKANYSYHPWPNPIRLLHFPTSIIFRNPHRDSKLHRSPQARSRHAHSLH